MSTFLVLRPLVKVIRESVSKFLDLVFEELQRKGRIINNKIYRKLFTLPFFHALFCTKGNCCTEDYQFWADATYTLIVKHNGDGVALIGFEISSEFLFVHQLQGVHGKKLFGIDLGVFLLEYAEVIARALNKSRIYVQPASVHPYYELDEDSRLYPQLYEHQARMRKRYDGACRIRGYEEPNFFCNWWVKPLRKRITMTRKFTLYALLLNRSLRRIDPSLARDMCAGE